MLLYIFPYIYKILIYICVIFIYLDATHKRHQAKTALCHQCGTRHPSMNALIRRLRLHD